MSFRFFLPPSYSSGRTSLRVAIFILLGCALLQLSLPAAHAQSWRQTSGPFGAVSVLASGGSTLYGGEVGGTIFVLDDDGSGWTRRKVGDNRAPITALAASGDTLYAGTGRGELYKSADRGATWRIISPFSTGAPRLATLLVEGDTIFMAFEAFNSAEDGSVRRSYDGGATWTELKEGLPGRDIMQIVRHEGWLVATMKHQPPIYRSSDNGATWRVGTFPRQEIMTMTSADGSLYAASPSQIYRSTNVGDSWEEVTNNAQGLITSIVVSGDTIVASTAPAEGNGFFNVAVGGSRSMTQSYPGGETRGLLALVLHKGLLHVGTGRGVYRATFATVNTGERWEPVNRGLTNAHVTDLAYDGRRLHATSHTGWGGANGGGVFSTDDLGVTWREDCRGLQEGSCYSVFMRDSKGLLGGQGGLALKRTSSDPWVFEPIIGGSQQPVIRTVYITKKLYMLVGDNFKLIRSDASMSSWHAVKGLPPPQTILSFTEQEGIIYVGTEAGVFRSENDGAEWSKVTNLDLYIATSLVADSGDIYAGTLRGIYRSSDRGASWVRSSDGLSEKGLTVSALVMQGSTVYAGTGDGIFRSTDRGTTWSRTDSVLNGILVTSFAVGPNRVIFAGTDGYGVFRTGEVLSAPEQVDLPDLHLLGNHPNPWSERTTIRFTLDAPADVSISLHDPLGSRVRTLLNERREAGEHNVGMDDTGLPPGVYYYTLRAGERIETGKMILTGGAPR